jgi:nucleoside phosphorylase
MIAIVFALPEESADFRRAIRFNPYERRAWRAVVKGREILLLHCGVGSVAAARSMADCFADHRPDLLIATGFAGALAPDLATGDLVAASNWSDPALLSRDLRAGVLISVSAPVETVAAKAALHTSTGAIAVDMETATIAAACAAAGVPLLAVRAISDAADRSLPIPFDEWFDLTAQRPRKLRLLMHLVRHPGRIRAFADFVKGLSPARKSIAAFLVRFLEKNAAV